MKDVEFPIMGTDNLGNSQMMFPENEYQFPGDMVMEVGDRVTVDNVKAWTDSALDVELVALSGEIIEVNSFVLPYVVRLDQLVNGFREFSFAESELRYEGADNAV